MLRRRYASACYQCNAVTALDKCRGMLCVAYNQISTEWCIMSISRLCLALSTAMVAATPVMAQQLSVSAGVTLVTEYEANGVRQSDGPAVQGYVQGDLNGFYAGLWVSNVDPVIIDGDEIEFDLYLGYANQIGSFSYDVSYFRYYYDNSGFCCGDLVLTGEAAVSDAVSVGLRLSSDPDAFSVVNSRLFGSVAVTETVSLDARYGTISGANGHEYWSIGASHAVSDMGSVFASYHETSLAGPNDNLFLLGLSLDFSLR